MRPLIQATTTALLALVSTCAFSAASAQEDSENVFQLAPFTVSADGAQSILVVSERDLAQRQAIDLDDALSIDPSITVGGSTAIAQKIYVRNLGEGLINVSVDGATQSGSLFHHIGRIAIEPELLKQVEIQPGVGNASDGPGALGGAIRFVTKDPNDFLRAGEQAGGLAKYGYFSNSTGHKGSVTGFGRLNDSWSGLVSIVVSDHDDMKDGDGNRLAGSSTRQEVALAKVVGELEGGHTIRVSVERLDEEGIKLRRPEWAPSDDNPAFPMESQRTTATVGYLLDSTQVEWLNLDINASYSEASILQNRIGPYEGKIKSSQFRVANTNEIGDSHRIVYGLDHRNDKVMAGFSTAPATHSEEGSVSGAFVQGEFDLIEQLTLTAGARLDAYDLDDREGQNFSGEGLSPNIGLRYKITQELSANVSYATAYRGPDINDAFRVDVSHNDPNMVAEKARNYEFRLTYLKNSLLLESGVYRNRIEDVITNTLPWSRDYTNAGELETDGFFARVSYTLGQINMSLQYNHADTTINDQIATRYQYSSLVSRIGDTWVADVSWQPVTDIGIGWNMRLVEGIEGILIPDDISGVPGTYINKPGYVTHDFYVRWTPAFADYLTVNITLKNAFNKQYLSHGSVEDLTGIPDPEFRNVVGAPEQGRDLRISATLRF